MDLRYPIGGPQIPEKIDMPQIETWIIEVATAPELLRKSVAGLTEDQLNTPYRPGGWSVRQVVHHLPDTHMNTYLNFRMALTDQNAVMRPTNVDGWGSLEDYKTQRVQVSLDLFQTLQERWVALLKIMSSADFERTIESARGPRSLAELLGIYAWHGKHHVAHITSLRERMEW